MRRIDFNSRPSARGDHWMWERVSSATYFNSRPSARGDSFSRYFFIARTISIHAPPRGATEAAVMAERYYFISIHAPPRGATMFCSAKTQDFFKFQFTPLREGRPVA